MSVPFFSVGARVLMMGYWRGVAQDSKASSGMRKMASDLIRYEEQLCKTEAERDEWADAAQVWQGELREVTAERDALKAHIKMLDVDRRDLLDDLGREWYEVTP